MSANGYHADDLPLVALLQPQPTTGFTASEVQRASLSRLLEELERGVRAVKTTERLFERLEAAGCVRPQKTRKGLLLLTPTQMATNLVVQKLFEPAAQCFVVCQRHG